MKSFLRQAADWTSEALETASGWALSLAIAYALLFVDIGGRGALFSHIRSMLREGRPAPAAAAYEGVRVIKLGPAQERRAEGLQYSYVREESGEGQAVVAVAQERGVSALTDSPADPLAAKDWKRGLKSELRKFTVYGNGSQTTSAAVSVQPVAAPAETAASAAAVATAGSAYRQGFDAAARPAIGARARALGQNGSDSVRNVKR